MSKAYLKLIWGETHRRFHVERTARDNVETSTAYARPGYRLIAIGLTEGEADMFAQPPAGTVEAVQGKHDN